MADADSDICCHFLMRHGSNNCSSNTSNSNNNNLRGIAETTDRQKDAHPHGVATAAPPPPPQGGPCPLLKLLTSSKAFTLTTPISCTAPSSLLLSPTLALPLPLAILRLHLLSPEGETFRPQIAFNHCKMQEEILLEASKERQINRQTKRQRDS